MLEIYGYLKTYTNIQGLAVIVWLEICQPSDDTSTLYSHSTVWVDRKYEKYYVCYWSRKPNIEKSKQNRRNKLWQKEKICTLFYSEGVTFPIISELPIRGTSARASVNDGMHSIPTFAAFKPRIKGSCSCIAEFQTKHCRLAANNKVNTFIKHICPLSYPIFVIPK